MKVSSVRFVGGVLLLSAAVGLLYFIYLISIAHEIAWTMTNCVVLGGLPGLTLCAVVFCFRAGQETKTMVAIAIVSAGASFYAAELYLALGLDRGKPLFADRRSKVGVILDLRRESVDAFPTITPLRNAIPSFPVGNRHITFLSGISNVTTVYCNESGEYLIYESDEYGFRNPRGAWSMDEFDIALVGDSYTHGACVPEGEDLGSWIRKSYKNTLNLGYGGNDPMLMLAGVREYLAGVRPKVVLWIQADVALDRTNITYNSLILRRYLDDPGFRQGLMRIQPEIDRALRDYIDKRDLEETRTRKRRTANLQFLKLTEIRHRLGAIAKPHKRVEPPMQHNRRIKIYREVLDQAARTVRGWGGQLYFVYIIGGGTLYYSRELRDATASNWREKCRNGDIPAPACDPSIISNILNRNRIIEVARSLDLPILDFTRVTDAHPDPRSLLTLGVPNHLGSKGYRFLARTILERLKRDSALPPPHRGTVETR